MEPLRRVREDRGRGHVLIVGHEGQGLLKRCSGVTRCAARGARAPTYRGACTHSTDATAAAPDRPTRGSPSRPAPTLRDRLVSILRDAAWTGPGRGPPAPTTGGWSRPARPISTSGGGRAAEPRTPIRQPSWSGCAASCRRPRWPTRTTPRRLRHTSLVVRADSGLAIIDLTHGDLRVGPVELVPGAVGHVHGRRRAPAQRRGRGRGPADPARAPRQGARRGPRSVRPVRRGRAPPRWIAPLAVDLWSPGSRGPCDRRAGGRPPGGRTHPGTGVPGPPAADPGDAGTAGLGQHLAPAAHDRPAGGQASPLGLARARRRRGAGRHRRLREVHRRRPGARAPRGRGVQHVVGLLRDGARQPAGCRAGPQGPGRRGRAARDRRSPRPRQPPDPQPATAQPAAVGTDLDRPLLRRAAAWYYAAEYVWRYQRTVAPQRRRGSIVLVDRYVYDLRESPWPGSMASRVAEVLVPRPDILVLPDAPDDDDPRPQARAQRPRAGRHPGPVPQPDGRATRPVSGTSWSTRRVPRPTPWQGWSWSSSRRPT